MHELAIRFYLYLNIHKINRIVSDRLNSHLCAHIQSHALILVYIYMAILWAVEFLFHCGGRNKIQFNIRPSVCSNVILAVAKIEIAKCHSWPYLSYLILFWKWLHMSMLRAKNTHLEVSANCAVLRVVNSIESNSYSFDCELLPHHENWARMSYFSLPPEHLHLNSEWKIRCRICLYMFQ